MTVSFFQRCFAAVAAHPFLTLFAAILIPAALQHATVLRESIDYPGVCEKDYIQDYAMIAALRAGEDPYAPIPELVARHVPQCQHVPINAHPSPHPLTMAALTSPLAGILTYPQSYALWASFEFLALLAAMLLLYYLPERRPPPALIVACLIPVLAGFRTFDTIFLGQANFTVLALIAAGILLLKRNEWAGGLILGFAIGIKFFGWPIAAVLLLRRHWKAFVGTLAGFALMQGAAIVVAGFDSVLHYYQSVTQQLSNYYAACGLNQSLLTLPQHLFQGYSEPCYNWPDDGAIALPFYPSPALLHATELFLPILIAVAFFYFALRTRTLRDALIAISCFGVVASPVVWGHAAVLSYITIASLYTYGSALRQSPAAITLLTLWILGVFVIPTFVPGSPQRDILAALHNTSVLIAALSATALSLWLPIVASRATMIPQKEARSLV